MSARQSAHTLHGHGDGPLAPETHVPATGRLRRTLTSDGAARVTFYLTGLLFWVLLSLAFEQVPGPVLVVQRLYEEFARGEVFSAFSKTLIRFFTAVAIAAVAGITIGTLLGLSKLWRAFMENIVLVGLSLPAIIWAFLTVMWFGFGWQAPVSAAVLAATPFVAVNVSKGVRGISRDLHDMSRAYGVSLMRRIRHLVLPAVTGYIVSGIRFAVIIGWNAVLLSEWFAAGSGVGFRSRYWYDADQFGGFLAWVALFVAFIIVLDQLILARFSRRAFAWRDAEEETRSDVGTGV